MFSPTSAARDVYEKQREVMRRREASFACLPGQTGVLALWSGRVAGLDVVASDQAYAKLHGRLVRSYALDAPAGSPSSAGHDRRTAEEWLAALDRVEATEHESPGNGLSYRFTGKGVVGAALGGRRCRVSRRGLRYPDRPECRRRPVPRVHRATGTFPLVDEANLAPWREADQARPKVLVTRPSAIASLTLARSAENRLAENRRRPYTETIMVP